MNFRNDFSRCQNLRLWYVDNGSKITSKIVYRQFIENNLWLSSIYHPIYSNYTRKCISRHDSLSILNSLKGQIEMQEQDSSSNDFIDDDFNVNFAQHNLLWEHSRFKKTGTGTSFTFIESAYSSVIRHFIVAVDKFNFQLSFSQYRFFPLSVMDPLTHGRPYDQDWPPGSRIFWKALLTGKQRKISRIARHTIYISQTIIVTLCWSYAFIFFKNFDKKVQQSWSSNSFLSILGDVLFLPIIKDRVYRLLTARCWRFRKQLESLQVAYDENFQKGWN